MDVWWGVRRRSAKWWNGGIVERVSIGEVWVSFDNHGKAWKKATPFKQENVRYATYM